MDSLFLLQVQIVDTSRNLSPSQIIIDQSESIGIPSSSPVKADGRGGAGAPLRRPPLAQAGSGAPGVPPSDVGLASRASRSAYGALKLTRHPERGGQPDVRREAAGPYGRRPGRAAARARPQLKGGIWRLVDAMRYKGGERQGAIIISSVNLFL